MLVCWVVFPILLCLVASGCGLLVDVLAGFRVAGALVPVLGIAVIIVVVDLATISGATAKFAAPLVVALALCGYGLSHRWRKVRVEGWALGCAIGVFAVYAAPIVLSGHATFAGYISLDDTNTWLALASHMMDHGRSLSGLPPSTYQRVLTDYLAAGYPLGGFALLGLGGKLTGQSLAWLFQPTIATLAAMLALAIYSACARLVPSRPLRGLVAFIGAQPALLFAYGFWSGIKELNAACLIALVCALAASTYEHWASIRGVLPTALAMAAVLAVLGVAGGVWLIGPALIVAAVLARRQPRLLLRAGPRLVGLVALLSLPALLTAHALLSGDALGDITSTSNNIGNLGHPLSSLQLLGIWPATDFRSSPHNMALTYVLLAVLILAIAAALCLAWRRRCWDMPLYLATAIVGFALAVVLKHVGLSSPWLNAKTMAEASPAFVACAMAGAAAVFSTGRRTEAMLACAAIAGGVLWSNGLAYANVWLAPHSELAELQTIDSRFAGDGPTLMTEYEPYGARYLLRDLDPEGASERRARLILLRSGGVLPSGQSADLDEFDLSVVLVYRTLVLRRSPVESRPPSVYHLVWKGHWYEVWQRPQHPRSILEHLSLGNPFDPAAVPACTDVLRLGRLASRAGGLLATVERPDPPIVLDLAQSAHPASWQAPSYELDDPASWVTPADGSATLVTNGAGTLSLDARVPTGRRYDLWLGGSFRRTLTATVDGRAVGSVSDQLNNSDQWTPLGSATVGAGEHVIALRYGGSRLTPGSGGFPFAIGPLALSTSTADLPVTYVTPSNARSLCGKRLDWLEALGP